MISNGRAVKKGGDYQNGKASPPTSTYKTMTGPFRPPRFGR